jgi:hypothetical protein
VVVDLAQRQLLIWPWHPCLSKFVSGYLGFASTVQPKIDRIYRAVGPRNHGGAIGSNW